MPSLDHLYESRLSPFYQDHHRAWGDTLRRWVEKEIMPRTRWRSRESAPADASHL